MCPPKHVTGNKLVLHKAPELTSQQNWPTTWSREQILIRISLMHTTVHHLSPGVSSLRLTSPPPASPPSSSPSLCLSSAAESSPSSAPAAWTGCWSSACRESCSTQHQCTHRLGIMIQIILILLSATSNAVHSTLDCIVYSSCERKNN